MKLLEEHVNNKNQNFNFWEGYDKETISAHPEDGSKGMMIVFIPTSKLKEMLDSGEIKSIENLNSTYVGFYEVPDGYNRFDDLIRKFRMKFNQPFKGLFAVASSGLN